MWEQFLLKLGILFNILKMENSEKVWIVTSLSRLATHIELPLVARCAQLAAHQDNSCEIQVMARHISQYATCVPSVLLGWHVAPISTPRKSCRSLWVGAMRLSVRQDLGSSHIVNFLCVFSPSFSVPTLIYSRVPEITNHVFICTIIKSITQIKLID